MELYHTLAIPRSITHLEVRGGQGTPPWEVEHYPQIHRLYVSLAFIRTQGSTDRMSVLYSRISCTFIGESTTHLLYCFPDYLCKVTDHRTTFITFQGFVVVIEILTSLCLHHTSPKPNS